MAVIYLITNTINNKQYVGVTTNFKQRMCGHKSAPNNRMYEDIKLHKWNNFIKKIIFVGDLETCYKLEQEYIAKYNCKYNINIGGFGNTGILGEDNGMSILSESKVLEMREYFFDNDITFTDLGNMFNISRSQANKVIHGKFWKDVGGPIVTERLNASNAKAKITEEGVIQLREDYFNKLGTMSSLGSMYSLSQQQSSRIINGLRWKDAGGPIKGKDY